MTTPTANPSLFRPHVLVTVLVIGITMLLGILLFLHPPQTWDKDIPSPFKSLFSKAEPPPVIPRVQFHGIVQDEHGKPIPLAMIEFTTVGGGFPGNTTAGMDGRFTFTGPCQILEMTAHGQHGIHAKNHWAVPFPTESGVTSYRRIRFVDDPSLATRYDSPAKAFVFTVWEAPGMLATPTINTDFHFSSVNPAGTPVTIRLDDPSGASTHTIGVHYHSKAGPIDRARKSDGPWDIHPASFPDPYAWGATVTPAGASIIERDPAQARPEAPADGYLSAAAIDFPATMAKADWKTTTVRRYYLHFPDDTYGIMTLRINSGTHEIHGKIRRNPKAGERDLTGVYSGDYPGGRDYD